MVDQSYVRTEMLSEQPAPLGETGILRWMRDNLFSSIPNIAMTLISVIVVGYLLIDFIPWAWQDSWLYESRRACLDSPVITSLEVTGACWGVITDRFNQLMFGFYPHEEQWRVLVAGALLLVAIAPVLFEKLPRKMVWFSAVYPFLGYWLLWGGSIWGPLGVLLGFVIMGLCMTFLPKVIGSIGASFAAVLIPIVWWMFGVAALDGMITESIAKPRIPGQIEVLQASIPGLEAVIVERQALLPDAEAPIADLKAPIAGLSEDSTIAYARYDEIVETIERAENLERNQANLLAVTAELEALDIANYAGRDPEKGLRNATKELEAQIKSLTEKVEIGDISAAELQALRDELPIAEETLYDARLAYSNATHELYLATDAFESVALDVSDAETDLKNANKELDGLLGIDEANAELVTLAEELETLKAELPESVAGFSSTKVLDTRRENLIDELKLLVEGSAAHTEMSAELESISGENRNLLEEYTGAQSTYLARENAQWRVYAKAGLVGLPPVKKSAFGGLTLSLIIGIAGIAISFPLGIVLALGRQSDMFIVKILSVGYIEFIRGVPLITLLFVASVLLNYFMPPGTNFDLILRVVIMVTLFAAAYMAEVIRGGLAALDTGQYEAADALGLDYWKSMRLIIMPQALKIAIPGIVGTFIGLFKDTTLVSIIGLLDPIGLTNAIRGNADWNGVVWELYLFIALMFWVFTFGMSRYSMYLERKLQTGH